MKLSQFKFNLPESLIGTEPPKYRDEARLMVVNKKDKTIEHKQFKDLINYLDEDDLVVYNNSGVFPALLEGEKEKTNAKIKVILLRELNRETRLWDVIVDPARKIRIGNKLFFGDEDELVAEVIDNTTSRGRTIRFLYDMSHEEFSEIIYKYGKTPLPDEIQKLRPIKPEDEEWYQTIFMEKVGSVAPPFAGMHFSKHQILRMKIKGINFADITLHIGPGNFRDIEVEDLTKHKSDSEEMFISQETALQVNDAIKHKKHVCAIGTSTLKALESSTSIRGTLNPYEGWTNKFIFPPYEFNVVDSLVTNFNLPCSPMLLMTCAFGGYDLVMKAYKVAVEEKYKFFAYGDAMLII